MTKIIDAHVHIYDNEVVAHPHLCKTDPGFEEFVGPYTHLPKKFSIHDYLQKTQNVLVEGIVWHEFISQKPKREVEWACKLLDQSNLKSAMVALIDFTANDFDQLLTFYQTWPKITAVRQHLLYDSNNPLKRFTSRNDILQDPVFLKNLKTLKNYEFKCSLELFSSQLAHLPSVIASNPSIDFYISVMGWPDDLSSEGFTTWKKQMVELSKFSNICVSISAIECIFGMRWQPQAVSSWIEETINLFSPSRVMFGSHLPISLLSCEFESLYSLYFKILKNFSSSERSSMLCENARNYFRVS